MYRFLIYSSIYLPGLALVIVVYGVQLAWGFPPRCNWTYGEVFHPAAVPQPHISQLVIWIFGAKLYMHGLYFFFFWYVIYPEVLSENKLSAWLEASRTHGLCMSLYWVKMRFRGENGLPTYRDKETHFPLKGAIANNNLGFKRSPIFSCPCHPTMANKSKYFTLAPK